MARDHLDHDYVGELVALIGSLPRDARPRWGTLDRDGLIEHLVWTLRHAMGRSAQAPFMGNWITRRVVKPLLLGGWIRMPRNVRVPAAAARRGVTLREPGDLETLHALLEEYVNLVQADELRPAPHPAFGPMSVDDWDRLHVLHFEHHLRQFGLRTG